MYKKKLLEEEKARQLGMYTSVASAKLIRLVLFDLLKANGLNVCLRCKEKIAGIEEFSLDHEVPWLHNSADLFWDTSNVKFSHRKCNSGARRSRNRRSDGLSWKDPSARRSTFAKYYESPENRQKHRDRQKRRYAEKKVLALSANDLGNPPL